MDFVKRWLPELLLVALTVGGVVGIAIDSDSVIRLTPIYLLSNLGLLAWRLRESKKLAFAIMVAAIVGFVAEVIGVQTGLLFGDYEYGGVLGSSLLGVPLMLLAMWALVMCAIWSLLPRTLGWKRIVVSAILAVVYDITLEHFATRYGLWGWNGSIPLSNFVGWFLIAGIIAGVYHLWHVEFKKVLFAPLLLVAHTIFFLIALILA